jgi:hypothetical protein
LNDAGTGLLPVVDERSLAHVVDVKHGMEGRAPASWCRRGREEESHRLAGGVHAGLQRRTGEVGVEPDGGEDLAREETRTVGELARAAAGRGRRVRHHERPRGRAD